ncbi:MULTISPECIES: TIGR02680 family protein [unclassified Streptomyces]|uniref:TIGR02680 family protein n=1 Tax=unclassified Streptomyces TaxID=2593676 RepID=UPI0022B631B5|nr:MULTISPECIES: TIGR02680 family protein [unclassified Streptomyces]MCZ7416350.1 TIGR02680 family protein [Streptomyces sp. WMMC897]MCZ7433840.1 TIGR02680 family protein [Streptomyces sp. WMMC1477]
MTALPIPAAGRWRPLRIGLVDMFHYDAEEFWFHDGRLLLRGNNGTGKSKVLALTLPFLLDGDLSARRVEPDGDPGKRMEWNLLLGGEHPHPERLGYAWIEFGRVEETTGQERFRTLLCGLKAVSGRGIARHWFAVTEQRIGAGLHLLDATGTALSRDRLAEAIAEHGMVYDTATSYRRAVDESLFGLGERRYAALVDLLIQLRQPQLSKRPNEAALSRALTEALPPMDQAVIADVAEAFRSLDEEKDELRAAQDASAASSTFLEHYRRYARMASRRRARLPRTEHARYESVQRDLSRAQAEREQAVAERAEAEERLVQLEERATRFAAQDAALRAGPEMRDARALERATEDAARTAAELSRARQDREQASQTHTRAQGRTRTAENRLALAQEALDGLRKRLDESGNIAGLDGAVRTDGASEAELRRAAEETRARRLRAVEHVEGLAARAGRAERERRAALLRAEEAEADVTHSAEHLAGTEARAAEDGRALVERVRDHLTASTELRVPGLPGVLDATQEWTGRLDGANPARQAATGAHREATARLAEESARWEHRSAETEEHRGRLAEELAGLEAGGQRAPRPPGTRAPGARDHKAGSPFWRLVDFRPYVTAAERAGLEAALQASGLLDAWVCPDGTAVGADEHDVLLTADGKAAGACLAEVLRPAIDQGDPRAAAVGEATVDRLLASVGLVRAGTPARPSPETGTWIAEDGGFRVGALNGSWTKAQAEYVGEGAREEARRARITRLRQEHGALTAERDRIGAALRELVARQGTLDAELAALPDDDAVRRGHAGTAAALEALTRARERHEERSAELARATRLAVAAAEELTTTATDMRLPSDPAGLAGAREALTEHALLLAGLWPALREANDAGRALGEEREDATRAARQVAELAERADEAARSAAAADERRTTLAATVGSAVAELQRRLEETAAAARECEGQRRRTRAAHGEADRLASRVEGRIERLEQEITTVTAAREEAITALQRFARTGLLAVALAELAVPDADGEPWAATPAIALARTIEAELAATDESDSAWERVQKRLSEEFTKLQDALSRHGHTASAYPGDDGMRVEIVYQGRSRSVPELARALGEEVTELERILSAHEREILETHLITEVAGTLHELIGAAERQVRAMNAELEQRPTSTGMRLRLAWRPSRKAPPGLAQARERLRQSVDAWSAQDRAAVGEFLQEQIARQQAADSSGSWLEDLTAALDYRAWHEFGVERHQNGTWVAATGPASGGERVLAVSVPLFAAASSHYASAAVPHAPRLVTLDEAFAGVDDDSRAKCLGLLHAFDLDVVMTSEREWACYPQVPGIAIAQLSRVDGIPAVLVTRWQWDGAQRLRGPEPDLRVPTAAVPPQSRTSESGTTLRPTTPRE